MRDGDVFIGITTPRFGPFKLSLPLSESVDEEGGLLRLAFRPEEFDSNA